MIRNLLAILICLANASAFSAPAPVKAPKSLVAQVTRLTELLRDSYAVGYPDATMVQIIKRKDGDVLALTVFTVEGFGGGNNHTQYLAVFSSDDSVSGEAHFMLMDVIPIGGKGWRGVESLKARVSQPSNGQITNMAIDALEVTGNDAPNFPSKKVTVNVLLKDGRLTEQTAK